MKMNKELMRKKFEKLSDVNKVRYQLGRIISNQSRIVLIIGVVSSFIFGYLLSLPFLIRYGGWSRLILLVFLGCSLMMAGWVLFFVGNSALKKCDEELEKFLIEKSKK